MYNVTQNQLRFLHRSFLRAVWSNLKGKENEQDHMAYNNKT